MKAHLLYLVLSLIIAVTNTGRAFASTFHPGDPVGSLMSELSLIRLKLPGRQFRLLEAEVKKLCDRGASADVIEHAVGVLRYLRKMEILDVPSGNGAVMDQCESLISEARRHLERWALPLSKAELGQICSEGCRSQGGTQAPTVLSPYFRLPVRKEAEERIRRRIRDTLDQDRSEDLINDRCLSEKQRPLIARGFVKQVTTQLVWDGLRREVDREIRSLSPDLLQGANVPYRLPPKGPGSQPELDGSEIDLARTSNERLYGMLLLLLPLMADASDDAERMRFHNAVLTITTEFPPHSVISARLSAARCGSWWVILFAHFESNDGNLLIERHLTGRCFAYDTTAHALYEYVPSTRGEELVPLVRGENLSARKGLYFLEGYRFRELLNALNLTTALARLWKCRGPVHGSAWQRSVRQCALALGEPEGGVQADGGDRSNQVRLAYSGGVVKLQGTSNSSGGGRASLTRAMLPRIRYIYRLAPDHDPASPVATVPRDLFRNGAELVGGGQEVAFCAPGRLKGKGVAVSTPAYGHDGAVSGNQTPFALARQLVASNLFLALGGLVDDLVSDARPENASPANRETQLCALEFFARYRPLLPISLQSRANDLRIGLLRSLGRNEEALALLSTQARLMRSNTDAQYVQSYAAFYRDLWPRGTVRTRLSTTTLECFTCARHASLGHDGATSSPAVKVRIARSSRQGGSGENVRDALHKVIAKTLNEDDARYARQYLDIFWKRYPEHRAACQVTAARLSAHWKKRCPEITRIEDPYRRASQINTLVWETYHILHAAANPDPAQRSEHERQLSRLRQLLLDIPAVVQSQIPLRKRGREAVHAEISRSIQRLAEYSRSPAHPYLYYPLAEQSFKVATQKVVEALKRETATLAKEYCEARQQLLSQALTTRASHHSIDYLQDHLHRWLNDRARTLVATVMGNIIRHYGLFQRDLDYGDRRMFPLSKTRGFTVVYRMVEGLRTELHIEWVVLP